MSLMSKYEDVRQSEIGLKISEMKHRFMFPKKYRPMQEAMDRFNRCECKKPKNQIRKEIDLCKKFWGCYPLHYFREDLYRRDRQLPEKELLNYIPEFFFYDLFLPFYDSDKYKILLEDKIITEQLFRSLGIPQPHTICKLINNRIHTNELEEIEFEVVEHELIENSYNKLFVKPTDGRGGYGIYVFNKNDSEQYVNKDGKLFNEESLNEIAAKNDYIVQAGIEQDGEISKIYPHSVNTFRIATENRKGNIRLLFVEFRLGRNECQLDNTCQGGLNVKIDNITGEMGRFAYTDYGEIIEKHPDTKFIFGANKIVQWDEIKLFAFELARKLPQFTFLGQDIALSKHGPLAIEANVGFGIDPQSVHGGLRDILQIENPQFYWRNRGKR